MLPVFWYEAPGIAAGTALRSTNVIEPLHEDFGGV
jgi:hypothetical protein